MRCARRDGRVCTGSSAVRSRRELGLLRRLWRTISARVRWRATSAKLLPRRSTPPQRRTNSAPRRMCSRGRHGPSRSSATTPISTPNSTTWRSTTGAAPASSTSPATRGPSSDLVAATSLALDRGDHVLALRAIALAFRAFPPPAALDSLAARAVDEAPEGTACAAVARGLRALLAAIRGQPFDLAEAEAAVEALDTAIPLDLSWYVRDCFVDLLLGLPDLDRCREVLLSTVALGERHKSPLVVGMATIVLSWVGARAADRGAMETVVQRVRATLRGRWMGRRARC